jgi:hypothetical protein
MAGDGADGVGAFVDAVVSLAATDGSRVALAAAARSLAASSGVTLDERSLRLFTKGSPARTVRPGGDVSSVLSPPASAGPTVLGTCLEALLTGGQRVAGAHHTSAWVAERVVGLALDGTSGPGNGRRFAPGPARGPESSWASVSAPTASTAGIGGPAAGRWPVCDPAVGGGVFLLAAADRLHRTGVGRAEVLEHLWGFDTDPLAVAVTETALALWAGVTPPDATDRLVVGDFLDHAVERVRPPGGWSLIVGNPPFQSQLAGRAVRDRDRSDRLRTRFGSSAAGYVDEAGLFVLAATLHLAERGRLAMILPASLLAARDADRLRDTVTATAPIGSVWVPDRQLFAASVDVVVPVFERVGASAPAAAGHGGSRVTGLGEVDVGEGAGGPGGVGAGPEGGAVARDGGVVVIRGGAEGERGERRTVPNPGSGWSALLADAEGVPRVLLEPGAGGVGDLAAVTAGFRQQFYGLAGAVSEGKLADGRPLLTVGLVDPLTSHWGRRTTRLAGTRYRSPVVDPEAIDDAEVEAWVKARLRPKVMVATQTRVLEAVADPAGSAVPSTPLISVEPHDPDADLWRLLAVLCAPPVTAWFHRHGAGAGLSVGRIRPTAKRVRAVPLPPDAEAWGVGADLAREASAEIDLVGRHELLLELGVVMTTAYGARPEVTSWWTELLPQP